MRERRLQREPTAEQKAGATWRATRKVLGQIDAKSNPQKFADMLAASGHVETTNNYAKTPRAACRGS